MVGVKLEVMRLQRLFIYFRLCFFASIIRVKSLVTENDLFIATDDKILDLSLNIDLLTIYRTR